MTIPYNDKEHRITFNSNSFINTFVANGVLLDFELTFDHVLENSIIVYIDDIRVTDYIINNTTLMFETAPAINSKIVVSSLLIGSLDVAPIKTSRLWLREETSTIPDEFGPCDVIELFVGGTRLRKDPLWQYNEKDGATSPGADVYVDAEFSVNGIDNYIRLTNALPADVTIEIVRRTGQIWYDTDDTLLNNTTLVAQAIAQKTSLIPE